MYIPDSVIIAIFVAFSSGMAILISFLHLRIVITYSTFYPAIRFLRHFAILSPVTVLLIMTSLSWGVIHATFWSDSPSWFDRLFETYGLPWRMNSNFAHLPTLPKLGFLTSSDIYLLLILFLSLYIFDLVLVSAIRHLPHSRNN